MSLSDARLEERRRWLRQAGRALGGGAAAWAAGGIALSLSGCGFQLRQTPEFGFRSISLQGFGPRSGMAGEFRRMLATQVAVMEDPARADVVLLALLEARDKLVTALTAAGQVRGLQLRLRFRFQLTSAAGRELIGPTELMLVRDLTTTETAALAKVQEEAEIYGVLERDLVGQVLRRLETVKLDGKA